MKDQPLVEDIPIRYNRDHTRKKPVNWGRVINIVTVVAFIMMIIFLVYLAH